METHPKRWESIPNLEHPIPRALLAFPPLAQRETKRRLGPNAQSRTLPFSPTSILSLSIQEIIRCHQSFWLCSGQNPNLHTEAGNSSPRPPRRRGHKSPAGPTAQRCSSFPGSFQSLFFLIIIIFRCFFDAFLPVSPISRDFPCAQLHAAPFIALINAPLNGFCGTTGVRGG